MAFAFGLLYINQSRVAAEIDRELMERVNRGRGPGGRGQGGPGGPSGVGIGGPFERFQGPPGGQGQGGQPGLFPSPGQIPRGLDAEGFRIASLRRPRLFNESLEPLSEHSDRPFDAEAAGRALREGRTVYTDSRFDNESIRVISHPVRGPGGAQLVFQAAREKRELDRLWRAQLITLAIFLPVALLAAGFGAMFLTSRALKPIGEMEGAAARISGSNLGERLQIDGQDEFARLGQTFNGMLDRLEKAFIELQDAFERQQRFTADASHELRTPLTRLKLSTSSALDADSSDQDRIQALRVADEAAENMTRLVNQLLILAKADSGQLGFSKQRTDLRITASEAIELVQKPRGIELRTDFPDHAVYAEVDPDAIRRVVVNVVENAYRYAPNGSVSVSLTSDPASILVEDNGVGISAESLPKVGQRFFRADAARAGETGGVGLGLAICHAIMEAHGGRLEIHSEAGKGTRVQVIFETISSKQGNQTTSS